MTKRERQRLLRSIFLGVGGGLAAAIPFSNAYPRLQIACAVAGPICLAIGGQIAAGEFNDPAHNKKAPGA